MFIFLNVLHEEYTYVPTVSPHIIKQVEENVINKQNWVHDDIWTFLVLFYYFFTLYFVYILETSKVWN